MDEVSPLREVAPPQFLRSRDYMKEDGEGEDEAERDVPVEEVEASEVELTSRDPIDAQEEDEGNGEEGKKAEERTAVPAAGRDDAGPDAAQLSPQQQEEPDPSDSVQDEDKLLLWQTTDKADQTRQKGQPGGEREAPIC